MKFNSIIMKALQFVRKFLGPNQDNICTFDIKMKNIFRRWMVQKIQCFMADFGHLFAKVQCAIYET